MGKWPTVHNPPSVGLSAAWGTGSNPHSVGVKSKGVVYGVVV